MTKINSDKIFKVVNVAILCLLTIIFLYPLYFTVIASFSEPVDVVAGKVMFWLKGFCLDGYKAIIEEESIWIGYRNSLVYTVLGTLFTLMLEFPAAYSLSKKKLWKRGVITTYFAFTMFFSGGMLPSYLLVKSLGLINKPYTLIILGSISVYHIVVIRTYFQSSIPESLFEAAEIDGCSQFGQFFKIAIPLAKPIIAVISLYCAVGRWNGFFSALVYINTRDYYPLQLVLRNILLESQNILNTVDMDMLQEAEIVYIARRAYIAEAMKYAVIFVSSLPLLIAYPFVQKYFVKGIMVGSIKG